MRLVLLTIFGMILAGMAPASSAPLPTNDFLGKYRGYSCDALFKEARAVSDRAVALVGDKHRRDAGISSTQAAVVLPTVLDSTKQLAGEIAVLRQQMQAIEDVAIQSQCSIEFVHSTNQ